MATLNINLVKYTTFDYVVMAMLSAISAVAYVLLAQIWTALTSAFGPLGGALLGMFQFGHILAFAILKKPGVAFITSLLTTVGQLLLGDPSGAYVLGWGIFHGVGAETVFALCRYKNWTFPSLAVAAGVAATLGQCYSYFIFGWDSVISLFYISLPILFLSSAIESGTIASLGSKAFEKLRPAHRKH